MTEPAADATDRDAPPLDPEGQRLWRDHLRFGANGQRKLALRCLDELLRHLAGRQAEADACAAWLCARAEAGIALPQPLLLRLVCPWLGRAWKAGTADVPYLLAKHCANLDLHPAYAVPGLPPLGRQSLLQEALTRDPSHRAARRLLVEVYAEHFNHAVHEVPHGVLDGMDGASPEALAVMLQQLKHFEALAGAEGMAEAYAERIATWRFHFGAYRDFLARRADYLGYADYLRHHPPPPG